MKTISKKHLLLPLLIFVSINVKAQYTQLIPSMQPAETGSLRNVPNYGKLLILFQEGIKAYGDKICQEKLNKDMQVKIDSTRGIVKEKTSYLVIIDYTNRLQCQVTTFKTLHGKPAAISDPVTKLLVYTIEIYPWMIINGKRY